MALEDDLRAVVEAAGAFAVEGEELTGVMAAEAGCSTVYLCAFSLGGRLSWLAVDRDGQPVTDRGAVREAVAIIGLCEIAEESAGGGDVGELRARLAELRRSESPEGIEDAERAAAELERAIAPHPRIASAGYLDAIGAAATKLEQTLGTIGVSPFAEAMRSGTPAVDELGKEVVENYKRPLG